MIASWWKQSINLEQSESVDPEPHPQTELVSIIELEIPSQSLDQTDQNGPEVLLIDVNVLPSDDCPDSMQAEN